jgi:hypothetical protein
MHPSIEATLCDWLKHHDDELPADFSKRNACVLFDEFRSKYEVENWPISLDIFHQFCDDVVCGLRCSGCGERRFPYFLPGDSICISCSTESNHAVH